MLVAKISTCILTFIGLFMARKLYEENLGNPTWASSIIASIAVILGLTYGSLVIATTNFKLFVLPQIILFIFICTFILLKKPGKVCIPFGVGIGITIIIYIATLILCIKIINVGNNQEEVSITSCKIVQKVHNIII